MDCRVLEVLLREKRISETTAEAVKAFVANNQTDQKKGQGRHVMTILVVYNDLCNILSQKSLYFRNLKDKPFVLYLQYWRTSLGLRSTNLQYFRTRCISYDDFQHDLSYKIWSQCRKEVFYNPFELHLQSCCKTSHGDHVQESAVHTFSTLGRDAYLTTTFNMTYPLRSGQDAEKMYFTTLFNSICNSVARRLMETKSRNPQYKPLVLQDDLQHDLSYTTTFKMTFLIESGQDVVQMYFTTRLNSTCNPVAGRLMETILINLQYKP